MMRLRNKFASSESAVTAGPPRFAPSNVIRALAGVIAVGAGLQPIAHASDMPPAPTATLIPYEKFVLGNG